MRIFSTPNFNQLNFKSSTRRVLIDNDTKKTFASTNSYRPENCDVLYSNYTHFFRSEFITLPDKIAWPYFVELLDENFKDSKKVNFYDFGCSDGSEPYSIIMALKENLGDDKSKKFFPIKAFDIDSQIIKQAASGKINANFDDIKSIFRNINNIDKYFDIEKDKSYQEFPYKLTAKENLREAVQFRRANFLSQIDNIEKSNSVVFCRNFWPYLTYEQRELAAKKLAQQLDSQSIVVIGSFDGTSAQFPLSRQGFKEIAFNIYKKGK